MAVTRYLRDTSGTCATWKMSGATGPSTKQVEVTSSGRTWDVLVDNATIGAGNWTVNLHSRRVDGPEANPSLLVTVQRVNSTCVVQETIFSGSKVVTGTTIESNIVVSSSESPVVFNAGDRIKVTVQKVNDDTEQVFVGYDSASIDSFLNYPDVEVGVTLQVAPAGVSTTSFTMEVSVLGTKGQSGTTFNLTVEARLALTTGGQSDVTSVKAPPDMNLETGVFLELTTGGVSAITAALLDVILTPFPRVIPVSQDGRMRWTQYRFDVDGTVDVLIAGFVVYVVPSGQLNVDEP